MRFDTKIAVIVRDDLADWQKLNVTAFLSSGLSHATDEIVGKPYEDASGNTYLPMFREPVLVYAADAPGLFRAHSRALTRALPTALYTEELFGTDNEDDNRATVRTVEAPDLNLVGLALYGPRSQVDKVTRGLRLHR
ncbi:DUF2000 domain-containing protein [Streptomyces botrytidirepellens]|uniref:DUF2000 domain-containing protein n=1 Tax=Streptomyces botrytidirepellens TaxID=2486417 RepID=A0A3M8VK61_9ACTN|nr:DUF2000 domain-containing protein [Streptomyces botrytidirepellens]RNG18092.1 DUF2000 domain-containing protein [Streptomyces botrytidirepellens]